MSLGKRLDSKFGFIVFFGFILIDSVFLISIFNRMTEEEVKNFDECVQKGYPVLNSSPNRECSTLEGQVFIEERRSEMNVNKNKK
ncbi:MAG: hypothetical protein AB1643_00310 [Patescibacteria group bacterium]